MGIVELFDTHVTPAIHAGSYHIFHRGKMVALSQGQYQWSSYGRARGALTSSIKWWIDPRILRELQAKDAKEVVTRALAIGVIEIKQS